MIDHRTIGSGDEPERTCLVVDPRPDFRHGSRYARGCARLAILRDIQRDHIALYVIQYNTRIE